MPLPNMPDGLHTSISQMKCFLRCPRQYQLKRDAVKLLDVAGKPSNGNLTATQPVVGSTKEETPGNSESYRGLTGAGKGI